VTFSTSLTGTVINETTAIISIAAKSETCTGTGGCSCAEHTSGDQTLILKDNERILQAVENERDFIRQ
jgi:hypothetical protein